MKTLVIVILCVLIFEISPLEKKNRVLLIGIDGVLQRCWDQADTSAFDYMMQQGSYTFNARTAIEAMSGPGWSNILCGMDTSSTGVVNNDWFAPWFYKKSNPITPVSGDDKPLPCVFQQIKNQKPDSRVVSFYSWDWLANLGTATIPGSIDKEIMCYMDDTEQSIKCDDVDGPKKAQELIKSDFDFFFYYLGSLDETGHSTKFCSDKYVDRLSALNQNVETIFDFLREEGIFNDTHIIFTTDHGASFMTYDHGDPNNDNQLIPWMIMGPTVKKNYEIKSAIKNMDTTPTILQILGLEQNELWRGKPVQEVFIKKEENKFLTE